jgi:hypothetical protein
MPKRPTHLGNPGSETRPETKIDFVDRIVNPSIRSIHRFKMRKRSGVVVVGIDSERCVRDALRDGVPHEAELRPEG